MVGLPMVALAASRYKIIFGEFVRLWWLSRAARSIHVVGYVYYTCEMFLVAANLRARSVTREALCGADRSSRS